MSELWADLSGLGTRDILVSCIDILLVYYVIYRVLLTIKGTRAAQMVIGIVLIGGAFFAAERFEMTTVSWLLDNFIEYFIIIVIVVFQQDIRRALMRIGQNVSRFGRTQAISHALEEVLAAAEHLAKARMGGIVVFEGELGLDEFIDHGEVIDARVSKELLVALFVPSRDNELHDGAIIIRDWRLQRAGTVLPLSRSDIASEFGTRHRAALGITEETDAVAIVVSEERGEMSLCFKGNIARDLEIRELRTALQRLFDDAPGESIAVADEADAAAAIAKAVAAMAGGASSSTGDVRTKTKSSTLAAVKPPTDKVPRAPTRSEPTPRTVSTTDSLRAATTRPAKDSQ